MDFAYSERSGEIVTSGPYSIVRHPFYLSYSLTWIGSLIIFDSIYLWGSTGILILLYFFSARAEEAAVLKSENAEKYRQYKKRVGMFLPVPRFRHSKVEGRT